MESHRRKELRRYLGNLSGDEDFSPRYFFGANGLACDVFELMELLDADHSLEKVRRMSDALRAEALAGCPAEYADRGMARNWAISEPADRGRRDERLRIADMIENVFAEHSEPGRGECGWSLDDEDCYQTDCGTEFVSPDYLTLDEMPSMEYCPNCGRRIRDDSPAPDADER